MVLECLINNVPVFYEEYGQGKPILCLHGFPLDHRVMTGCLEPVFKELRGYRRIYVDLPGMGRSPVNPCIENADDMLEVLDQFINKVIGKEQFLLIGESYGGYLSIGLIHRLSARTDGVFLLCPVTIPDPKLRNVPQKREVIIEKDFLNDIEKSAAFTDYMEYAVIVTEETWRRYKTEVFSGLEIADKNFTEKYFEFGYGFSFQSDLVKVVYEKPISVLTGGQDDCVGFEDAWAMVKHLPRKSFTVLDDAGHHLQIEKKDIVSWHLQDWLSRV